MLSALASLLVKRLGTVLQGSIRADIEARRTRGFEYLGSRKVLCGSEHAFRLPVGRQYRDIQTLEGALAASVGAPVELIDRGGGVIIRVVTDDLPREIQLDRKHYKKDALLLGYDRLRRPVYHPLTSHLSLGGTSGSGKTDAIRSILDQLIWQGTNEITVVDMKAYSFMPFFGIPGVRFALELDAATDKISKVSEELERREKAILGARSRRHIETMKTHVLIVDEGADLSPNKYPPRTYEQKLAAYCDSVVSRIARKGREPKVILIYCTQRPDYRTINADVKANISTTLCFRTKTELESRIIMDRPGAEKISVETPGRCIYSYGSDIMLQTPYLGGDESWNAFLQPYRTEVVKDGRSTRRAETPRKYIDGIIQGADRDDGAARTTKQPKGTGETSSRVPAEYGRGRIGYEQLPRPGEDMAPYNDRVESGRRVTFEVDDEEEY